LKAAFVYNFAKFTEWPDDLIGPPTTVHACVLGDDAVARALAEAVRGRPLRGSPIAVQANPTDEALPGCHMLYVSGADAARSPAILAAVRDAPVLTISDHEEFADRGGMIQLRVDAGRMRFVVNIQAAVCAGLSFSARMLALAEVADREGPLRRTGRRDGGVGPALAAGASACGPESRQP
jgi:hypothetical protein